MWRKSFPLTLDYQAYVSSSYLQNLTREQLRVVRHTGRHARVSAVAGSGKTTTMIARIGYLLENGVEPDKIMVLMFNRSARDGFERSMIRRLGPEFAKRLPEIRTFHSLGYRLVQSFTKRGSLSESSLVTEDYVVERLARQVLTEVYKNLHDDGWPPTEDIEEFLNFIDLVKATIDDPAKVYEQHELASGVSYFVDAYRLFETVRTKKRLRFYPDLIWDPVEALQRDPELVQWVANRVDHIIVDEYQDINEVQQRLLSFIAGHRANVMVVGDVDQCIYEWRGARPDFITHRFAQDFPDPGEYLLSRTFRFGHSLSLAADYLINNNMKRDDKLCVSHTSTKPTSLRREEEKGEHPVVRESQNWLKKGRQLAEMAVLVRCYAQSIPVELALVEADIPYRLEGGDQVFDCSEVVAMVGYLSLATGLLADEEAGERERCLRAMLSQPHPGMQREELGQLALELAAAPNREVDVLRSHLMNDLQPYVRKRLEEAADNWQWVVEHGENCRLAATFMTRLVERLRLYDFYYSLSARAAGAENRVKTCKAFIEFAGNRKESIRDFLARIKQLKKQKTASSDNGLLITSVHRAKGLEWAKVILPGLSDGMFPFVKENIALELEIEDERRLFYVAITRAIEELVCCHPPDTRLERNLDQGCTRLPRGTVQASRFLYEANIGLAVKMGRLLAGKKPQGFSELSAVQPGIANSYLSVLGFQELLKEEQAEPEQESKILSIEELKEGMSVYHSTFGAGIVTSIDDRQQGRLRVDFAGQGETVLLAAYARLQTLVN